MLKIQNTKYVVCNKYYTKIVNFKIKLTLKNKLKWNKIHGTSTNNNNKMACIIITHFRKQ